MSPTTNEEIINENAVSKMQNAFVGAVRELSPVIIAVIIYLIIVEAVIWVGSGTFANTLDAYLFFSYAIMRLIIPNLMIVFAVGASWILWKNIIGKGGNKSLTRQLIISAGTNLAKPEPWARLMVMVIIYLPFIHAFNLIKERIPIFQPFSYWDQAFDKMDRLLHFGIDPWQISWAIFSNPIATVIIDRIYISWFYAVYASLFAVILLDKNAARRTRFILSHISMWMLMGSMMGTAFSSAGPCFYEGAVGTHSSFNQLMANLSAVNQQYSLFAMDLQKMLWEGYIGLRPNPGGISAMPSLHIAQAVLLGLFAQTISRPLAVIAWGYVFVIFIGSIHLGWHYAVDGYASAIGAAIIWWLAGRLLKKQ